MGDRTSFFSLVNEWWNFYYTYLLVFVLFILHRMARSIDYNVRKKCVHGCVQLRVYERQYLYAERIWTHLLQLSSKFVSTDCVVSFSVPAFADLHLTGLTEPLLNYGLSS